MGRITSTFTALAAATVLTAGVAAAQGTLADRKTNVTFSGPVTIPGATLPAGTYVFKLADSPANRHIVMVFDRDEQKLVTTLLAVPAERAEPEGDPVVAFKETPADRPPAVRYWFYAGEKDGNEFVYPRAQAMLIAKSSGESVSAFDTDSNDLDAWKKGDVSKVSANADTQPAAASTTTASTSSTTASTSTTTEPKPAPAATPAATTAPVQSEPTPAPAAQEPRPMAAPAPVTTAPSIAAKPEEPVGTSGRAETLPRTASDLPSVLLVGVFALVGALGVHIARRSIA